MRPMSREFLDRESAAFRAGYVARDERAIPSDNPFDGVSAHQSYADWRDGWTRRDDEIDWMAGRFEEESDDCDDEDDCDCIAVDQLAGMRQSVIRARQALAIALGKDYLPGIEELATEAALRIAERKAPWHVRIARFLAGAARRREIGA